jgi:imidazoleglycerol phosphate synthase glutamine amidotransferase subunit HisH
MFFILLKIILNNKYHSFETRPGSVDRLETQPTQGWNRAGLKKKKKTWYDPIKNSGQYNRKHTYNLQKK